jgi:hypothetical protein
MTKLHRYLSACLTVLALVAFPTPSASAAKPQNRPAKRMPNVVIIFIDYQGYYDLGCYGATEVKTPRIDQLAAEGIRSTRPRRSAVPRGRDC